MRPARRVTLAELAARRRDCARDLDLLASGWTPPEAVLADAPYIDQWEEVSHPQCGEPCLRGRVSGHPILGTRVVWTSPIVARGDGWVRTEGRLYRLGSPKPAVPPPAAPPPEPVDEPHQPMPDDDDLSWLPTFR